MKERKRERKKNGKVQALVKEKTISSITDLVTTGMTISLSVF